MNIAETIYQHVKIMPMSKAIEVLHFIEFLETKKDDISNNNGVAEALEFITKLTKSKKKDSEINNDFQALRDEWNQK